MHNCPKCRSENIHRSRAKTRWEALRQEVTGKRPYRCHACGWRGWSVDLGPKISESGREAAERALAPDAPNLKGTTLARDFLRPGAIDLRQLDLLNPISAARSISDGKGQG